MRKEGRRGRRSRRKAVTQECPGQGDGPTIIVFVEWEDEEMGKRDGGSTGGVLNKAPSTASNFTETGMHGASSAGGRVWEYHMVLTTIPMHSSDPQLHSWQYTVCM